MTTRHATCRCGQLAITCTGNPVRVSVCHCYDCQKRSGSAFAVQARFPDTAVTVTGEHNVYTHVGDSGANADFHFCPTCGGTLWYHARPFREMYAVPVGAFGDLGFPAPTFSVWESRKLDWVKVETEDMEHHD